MLTAINTFGTGGLIPLYPNRARAINVCLAPTQTLAKGTVLGELTPVNDVQTVTVSSLATAGTYTLTLNGQTTAAIPYNATAAQVAAAVAALPSVGAGNVVGTGGPTPGTPVILTFGGALASTPVTLITSTTTTTGTNDVQTLTIGGGATGGTFTLTFGGQTTAAITYSTGLTAATVQTAFALLSSVGNGNVAVTGTAGGPYTFTFQGALANSNVGPITTGGAGSLTGGSPTIAVVHTTTGGAAPVTIAHTTPGVARGVYKAYASGNSDGSQVAKGILQYPVTVDASGNISLAGTAVGGQWGQTGKGAPMFFMGDFPTEELVGLDTNAVTNLGGHLDEGTVTTGVLSF